MKHTLEELKQWQALPLDIKIRMSKTRIRGWINEYGQDGVYVSFSGGKDSTVLLDLVRQDYPNIPAVFVDTGLEYPEIREFVKSFDNVVWLKPKLTFKQVIQKYGYPFFSKEVAGCISDAKKYLEKLDQTLKEGTPKENGEISGAYAIADLLGIERRKKGVALEDYEALKTGVIPNLDNIPARFKMLLGKYPHREKGVTTNEYSKMYDRSKYLFMLDAPFDVSNHCCSVMKKAPIKKYAKETGRNPMTAQMADESRLRQTNWLKNGCNGFELKSPISNPLSFWTEQDVLQYIKTYNLPICSVYGDIVEDTDGTNEVEGQMTISDMEGFENTTMFDADRLPLKTTGCTRTGCMFCGFGCHQEKESRFVRMKETHPKQYDYIMRPESEGGLNYKAIIDWINENGNMNIKY